MKKLRTVLLLLFMLLVSSTLPVYAQSSAGDFTYEEQGASVTITSYTGADQEVTIPAVINEKTVTAIGDYAFMLCNTVEKVNVPSTVKSISATAFSGANKLKDVVLASEDTVINQPEENKESEAGEQNQPEENKAPETAYLVSIDKSVDELAGTKDLEDTKEITAIENQNSGGETAKGIEVDKQAAKGIEPDQLIEKDIAADQQTGKDIAAEVQNEIAGMGDDQTGEEARTQIESGKKNIPVIIAVAAGVFVILGGIFYTVKKRKHERG